MKTADNCHQQAEKIVRGLSQLISEGVWTSASDDHGLFAYRSSLVELGNELVRRPEYLQQQ